MDNIYLFIDEGGDLNFSSTGTKYFVLTCVTTARPFTFDAQLLNLRNDFIETDLEIEYFHASEDKQHVRNKVFLIAKDISNNIRVDCVVVEKRKTHPTVKAEIKFYPKILGYLLEYIISGFSLKGYNGKLIVITDQIPINRKRKAIEKAIKIALSKMIDNNTKYVIYHHSSKSWFGLQLADYINWAVFRKWERNDERSYDLIKNTIRTEFDIFKSGNRYFY